MHENKLEELFKQGIKELGLSLDDFQIRLFFIYLNTLKGYSQKVGVTGIKTSQEIIIKHFLDSLTCFYGFTPTNGMKIIDIGTGAGFPGVPLKICYPKIELTLLDASEKHVEFLYHLKSHLQIEFEILLGRSEDFGKKTEYREKYDIAVARAVAKLNTLVEYALPFLKIGGIFISQKGAEVEDELLQTQKAIDILGGRFKEQKQIILPIIHTEKNLVIIEKIKSTPLAYPRRPGIPKKKPL